MEEKKARTAVLNLQHARTEMEIDCYSEADLSKPVANLIHQRAGDIGIDEKAHELYHKGQVEVTEADVRLFRQIVEESRMVVYAKRAIYEVFDNLKFND